MTEIPPEPRSSDAESTEFFEALVRSAELGVVAVDAQEQVIVFNEAAARLTRLEAGEVLRHPLQVLPNPLQQLLRETAGTGLPVVDRRLVLHAGSAHRRVVGATTSRWGEGTPGSVAVLAVMQDLTAAQELEWRTTRLQRLASVGTLSAGVAHEIKNALVAIKSFSDLLLEKGEDLEMANLVGREVSRIDSLVSQLLRFAGPSRPVFSEVRVHDSLENCLQLVQRQVKTRKLDLAVHLEAREDRVHGDARQLEQAFLNLLLNAIDVLGEAGNLTVTTQVSVGTEFVSKFEPKNRRPQLHVLIRDSGPGIPPEILPNLFKPFITSKPGGTGLGLAITRRIIRGHQGTITVETAVGQGTTFKIALPLSPPPA
jgi:two-component system nitrogen regulation sensor histidine kinase GlnL